MKGAVRNRHNNDARRHMSRVYLTKRRIKQSIIYSPPSKKYMEMKHVKKKKKHKKQKPIWW